MTSLAALRSDRIDAPCVLDQPFNAGSFLAYVEQFLVPTLRPGDIVAMDNLSSHKGLAIRQVICAAGANPADLRGDRAAALSGLQGVFPCYGGGAAPNRPRPPREGWLPRLRIRA
ncbi:MAG: transposase [Rubritepida sp.]|nr:transposase [Rubritepida sp.]